MKVAVDTYGCTHNKADGELIKAQLQHVEDAKESSIEESDIVILNTCAVKNKTQSRMLSKIKEYREKGKKVLVAGCLPKVNKELLEDLESPMVDVNSIQNIPRALKEISKGKKPIYFNEEHVNKLKMDSKPGKEDEGIVPIAEGCLGNCSYCGVKNSRGNLTSYSEEDILNRVRELLEKGKKEIYLTAEDTGCYGFDTGTDLPSLLEQVVSLKHDFKVRVGMMNPEHALKIQEKLIEELKNPKVYKFLHLPIQSGSNKVLEDMNRRYTVEEFKDMVRKIRGEIDNLNLATDIIVGYPTEEEKEFQETIKLIKEIKPDIVNISRFYPRPNTVGATLKQFSSQVLKERSKELSKETRKISREKNEEYIGKKIKVTITDKGQESSHGRTPNYKAVKLEKTEKEEVEVEITDASSRGLKGKQINT